MAEKFNVMEVLASGMSVARLRVNALASNIANAQTTRTEEGGPYKPRHIIQTAQTMQNNFSNVLDRMSMARPNVAAVVEDQSGPKLVYQPGHPDANAEGYVAYPNIDVVRSMTDLMTATRLYQANISALESTRRMMREAKMIGQF